MKSHDYIILGLIVTLGTFGLVAFFFEPKYAKGAELLIEALINALSVVLTYKFTAHQPTVPPGTEQITATKVPPVTSTEKVPNV